MSEKLSSHQLHNRNTLPLLLGEISCLREILPLELNASVPDDFMKRNAMYLSGQCAAAMQVTSNGSHWVSRARAGLGKLGNLK